MNQSNQSKVALRGLLSIGIAATVLASPALAQTPPHPSLHQLRHEAVRAHRAEREQHHQLVLAHKERREDHAEHHAAVVAHDQRRQQHYESQIRHQNVLARHEADRLKHEKS